MTNTENNIPPEQFNFKQKTRQEREGTWRDTWDRVQLYAVPSKRDDRIDFVIFVISFLPEEVRNVVLEESTLYIALKPYSKKHLAEFAEMFSDKALSEFQEKRCTLVKRSDGSRCIFIQIPGPLDKETRLGLLHQVARLVIGLPGYSKDVTEFSADLEQAARECATVLGDYVTAEVEFYHGGKK